MDIGLNGTYAKLSGKWNGVPKRNLNLNGLLVIRQIDNISPGGSVPGGKLVPGSHKRCELGHTDISAEEIKESGRSFQSLIVCGKKLLLYALLLAEGI